MGALSRLSRLLRAEQGVALISVMLAIFALTIVVAALTISSMGETTLSVDHLRGQQALSVAEAGAYRALAELRHRLNFDLNARIENQSSVDPGGTAAAVQAICTESSGPPQRSHIDLIRDYAFPLSMPNTDWTVSSGTATLAIGDAANRVQMADSGDGTVFGDFYATVAVRATSNYPGDATHATPMCQWGVNVPEQEILWFDYAI